MYTTVYNLCYVLKELCFVTHVKEEQPLFVGAVPWWVRSAGGSRVLSIVCICRRKAASRWSCHATGTLINTNTIEEFRNHSKQDLLKSCATTLWEAITSGQALQDPSLLASFLIFTFAVSLVFCSKCYFINCTGVCYHCQLYDAVIYKWPQ